MTTKTTHIFTSIQPRNPMWYIVTIAVALAVDMTFMSHHYVTVCGLLTDGNVQR